jgi:hypothetical protein
VGLGSLRSGDHQLFRQTLTAYQMNDTEPATKRDLDDLKRDLKQFIVEREVNAIRWYIGIFAGLQVTYFFGTLAAVWFMISHLPK